jgi:hypothetical protein
MAYAIMRLGYARAYTQDHDTQAQLEALKASGQKDISGKSFGRPPGSARASQAFRTPA